MRAGCDVGRKDCKGNTGRELAERKGHAAVVARLRAVVAEQLLAAQAVGPAPEPEPAAVDGVGGPASQLLHAALNGDEAAVAHHALTPPQMTAPLASALVLRAGFLQLRRGNTPLTRKWCRAQIGRAHV